MHKALASLFQIKLSLSIVTVFGHKMNLDKFTFHICKTNCGTLLF